MKRMLSLILALFLLFSQAAFADLLNQAIDLNPSPAVQSVMTQQERVAFFGPGSLGGGFFKSAAAPTPLFSVTPSDWLFDAVPSDEIVDQSGVVSMEQGTNKGTPGSGYVDFDGGTNNEFWRFKDNSYHDMTDYTIWCFGKMTDTPSNGRPLFALSDGVGATGSTISMYVDVVANVLRVGISDGTNLGLISASGSSIEAGDEFLVVVRYTAAADDESTVTISVTEDGVTWKETTSTTANLQANNTGFEFRSTFLDSVSNGWDAWYYRFSILPEVVVDDHQKQAIWDIGSENSPAYDVNRPPTMLIDGDSLSKVDYTAGDASDGWALQMKNNKNTTGQYVYRWSGVGGHDLADIDADVAAECALYASGVAGDIYVLWAGTNDIASGHTVAAMEASFESIVAKAKAAGYTVYVIDMIPRTAINTTKRADWNTYLAANESAVGYTLLKATDLDAFNAEGDEAETVTVYWTDSVHLRGSSGTGGGAQGMDLIQAMAEAVFYP